ncbi:Sterile alpha motif type [Echinococcus multilocularis]|uniref:Sterile alpha motif type n=1 Tax=Echinococcus multilocularis TaxID=6211 RepID=A0A068XXZ0_ECHMU|nr:Sterile alpha motif type [Echinococcus multilocularis]
MGINAVGDIITILQYCKSLDIDLSEAQTDVVVTSTTSSSEKPSILPGHELPVPSKRRVTKEMEGPYVVKFPEGKTEKTRRILKKMAIPESGNFSNDPSTSSQSLRTVVITATPSSTTKSGPDQGAPLDFDGESDDDNEDFEVIISSTSPDVRTANLGTRPYVARPSVFDRLGAEVSFPNVAAAKGPPALPPFSSATSGNKTVLSRIVDRTITSNAAEETRLHHSFAQSGSLKRSASESIFARLGAPWSKAAEDEPGLPYQGVLKLSRMSIPKPQPQTPSPPHVLKSPSNSQARVSAKSRLGFAPSACSPTLNRSAGIFATNLQRNVRQRLGRF